MPLRPDFCISDTHWFHKNIVAYQDRPVDHNEMMLKRWRTTVKPSHTVLHLGDLFFGRRGGLRRFTEEIAPQLTGHKYIVLGNHDARDVDYEALGFTVLRPYSVEYRDFTVSFDHYPKIIHTAMKRIHVHGHLHSNGYGPHQETERANNINVSVEVIDYRPQKFTSLVDAAILARKQKTGGRYYNSPSFRQSQTDRQRRAA